MQRLALAEEIEVAASSPGDDFVSSSNCSETIQLAVVNLEERLPSTVFNSCSVNLDAQCATFSNCLKAMNRSRFWRSGRD